MQLDQLLKNSKVINGIYAITIVFSASLAYTTLYNPPNAIVDLVENWKEQNIYDIETVPLGERCPLGYEPVQGFESVWRD